MSLPFRRDVIQAMCDLTGRKESWAKARYDVISTAGLVTPQKRFQTEGAVSEYDGVMCLIAAMSPTGKPEWIGDASRLLCPSDGKALQGSIAGSWGSPYVGPLSIYSFDRQPVIAHIGLVNFGRDERPDLTGVITTGPALHKFGGLWRV